MDTKKVEVRSLTKDFPNLVLPDGKPVTSMEIDVDALSKEEKYQYGGWDDSLRSIAAAWVKQHNYDDTGTIWQWGSPSVNFGHQSYSMFYAVLGMPKSFREYMNSETHMFGKHVRPNADEVIPSLNDGWDALCHIEDMTAWEPLDSMLWQEVRE